jgi:hypothetical protein
MSGPKRNPDKLNTIGVVVVGICGAVLVYVTIVALQAFYMNDTSELQTMKDYGGQDTTAKGRRADEMRNITEPASNPNGTYRIKIDDAIKLVVEDARRDPSHLTGSKMPKATKQTIEPQFGRPILGGPAAPEGGADAGEGAVVDPGAATLTPTGSGPAAPPGGPARDAAPQPTVPAGGARPAPGTP